MTPLRRTKLGSAAFAATLVMWIASGTAAPQRDALVGPDGAVYIATSNHDGRARGVGPFEGDDKVLRIRP